PDERIAAQLEQAARAASARAAIADAADLAERALALTPLDEPAARHRRTLLAARGRLEAGDTVSARELLEAFVERGDPGNARAEALAELGRIHMFEGTRRAAVSLLLRAREEAEDDPHLQALVVDRLVSTRVVLRESLHEAGDDARRVLELAKRLGDDALLARALSTYGFLGSVMGYPDALSALERAAAIGHKLTFFIGAERPLFNLACACMWTDELDRARQLFSALYDERWKAATRARSPGRPTTSHAPSSSRGSGNKVSPGRERETSSPSRRASGGNRPTPRRCRR
ncbi:MAG TPA: tetratricopeptide repeat protein, partial [Gaiellaceae bacterium]|nr:tetratricopeptide repeat protein [Gaiellaceae bacterium]